MRKIGAVFVFAVILFVTGVAQAGAATLTATEGFLRFYLNDRFADFSGDGFSVQMSSASGLNTPQAFGTGIVLITTTFGSANDGSTYANVQVGGSSCTALIGLSPGCGEITLASLALPLPPPPAPGAEDFIATAPFIAAGHLNVGAGFDFVGQGVLTGCIKRGSSNDQFPCQSGRLNPALLYTFTSPTQTVAEPPTLLLVISSFGALGVLFSARFLRRPPGSRLPEHS